MLPELHGWYTLPVLKAWYHSCSAGCCGLTPTQLSQSINRSDVKTTENCCTGLASLQLLNVLPDKQQEENKCRKVYVLIKSLVLHRIYTGLYG